MARTNAASRVAPLRSPRPRRRFQRATNAPPTRMAIRIELISSRRCQALRGSTVIRVGRVHGSEPRQKMWIQG